MIPSPGILDDSAPVTYTVTGVATIHQNNFDFGESDIQLYTVQVSLSLDPNLIVDDAVVALSTTQAAISQLAIDVGNVVVGSCVLSASVQQISLTTDTTISLPVTSLEFEIHDSDIVSDIQISLHNVVGLLSTYQTTLQSATDIQPVAVAVETSVLPLTVEAGTAINCETTNAVISTVGVELHRPLVITSQSRERLPNPYNKVEMRRSAEKVKAGVTTRFLTGDGLWVTVENGIITEIA
jgi:hypothetical protein